MLVLVNGRRAGTANISKLGTREIERIEIVRGPASVIYGSQNMGGVINIIMKSGENAPPSEVGITGGSWGLVNGYAQSSGGNDNASTGTSACRAASATTTARARAAARWSNTAWSAAASPAASACRSTT